MKTNGISKGRTSNTKTKTFKRKLEIHQYWNRIDSAFYDDAHASTAFNSKELQQHRKAFTMKYILKLFSANESYPYSLMSLHTIMCVVEIRLNF